MSRSVNMVLAGFGGQGVLFAGKLIAYAGLLEDREVSWLPSYGPEMRGGTANCSVCLSDDPIGSPLVLAPDVLVAMNQPSLDKFERSVAEGGIVVADSTLVQRIPEIEGVRMCAIPATAMAEEAGFKKLANIILAGKLFAETRFCEEETLWKAIDEVRARPRTADWRSDMNKQALHWESTHDRSDGLPAVGTARRCDAQLVPVGGGFPWRSILALQALVAYPRYASSGFHANLGHHGKPR